MLSANSFILQFLNGRFDIVNVKDKQNSSEHISLLFQIWFSEIDRSSYLKCSLKGLDQTIQNCRF